MSQRPITFKQMEGYEYELHLASVASVNPPIRRQFVAFIRLGYETVYVVRDDGKEVLRTSNWREALVEYNQGDLAGTMGEALVVSK